MRYIILLICLAFIVSTITPQEPTCAIPVDLPDYVPTDTRPFITLSGQNFEEGETAYMIHGINYYPMQYPWRRFLTETDQDSLLTEFDVLQDVGINTLRIFLWNQALFQCDGKSELPDETAFLRLDEIIQTAGDYKFRLIVTLNDMPELADLYANATYIQEQTRFIVNRYQNEPTLLAWDLRNEGDIDYGSRGVLETKFPRTQVLDWLRDTAKLVREIDSNHLITAGWLNEAHSTAPYVDFISFHHWTLADDLVGRIRQLRLSTRKPILLQEVGYSTLHANITPQVQAELLDSVIQTSIDEGLLGWMIWTAFDFPITATCYPSPCESPNNQEHYFGIWDTDYQPKSAVEIIRQYTG